MGAANDDAAVADPGDRPQLAEGIDLIGEMEGSGFKEAPSLVRRADGQVIQLTPLLYAVAAQADGSRSLEEIGDAVGADIGRRVSADNVRVLVEKKLRPLGVLAEADGSSPKAKKLDPLLALNFRAAVIPEGLSNTLAAAFHPLFWPPVVIGVLVALVAGDAWLFGSHGVAQAIRTGLDHPAAFLPLFAAVVISAALHEIGHAAACRYGGGTPGKMGCGLYLAWPAFYTDVTDAYRLGKKGRLRTDLGGVYLNVIVVLLTYGVYFATGNETVLLLVVIQHFEIVHQLLPVVRLDGYYIVADITGVPDLFARIRPILTSMLPWKHADERVTVLKRWVRVVVTIWVLVVVPLLLFQLLTVLIHLPRIIGTALASANKQIDSIQKAFSGGDALGATSGIIQLIVLSLPMLGILLMLVNLGRRILTGGWHKTAGRPVARAAFLVATAAAVWLLLMAWIPKDNYRAIRPGERGTLLEGATAVSRLPKGDAPLESERRAAAAGRLVSTSSSAPARSTADSTADPASTTATTDSPATTSTTEEPTTTTTAARSGTATTVRTTVTTTRSTTATSAPTTTTTDPPTTTTDAPTTTTAP